MEEGCWMLASAKHDQAPLSTCHKHNLRTLHDSCWDMLRTMRTMPRDWWRPWMRWAQSWGIYEEQLKRQGLCSLLGIGLKSVLASRQLPTGISDLAPRPEAAPRYCGSCSTCRPQGSPWEWCAVCESRRRTHEQLLRSISQHGWVSLAWNFRKSNVTCIRFRTLPWCQGHRFSQEAFEEIVVERQHPNPVAMLFLSDFIPRPEQFKRQ